MDPQEIKRRSDFVLKGERIEGGAGLTISGCSNVTVTDLDISHSRFSGLIIHACQNVRVIGGRFHDNGRSKDGSPSGRIGHGIFVTGDCTNISVEGAECMRNFEDGVQTAENFTGSVTLVEVHSHDNMENAVDQKGGDIVHIRPNYHGNGDGRGMEAMIVHKNARSLRVSGGTVVVKDDSASCLNVGNAAVAEVQGTVFDARGAKSFCVEGGERSTIQLFQATLLGSSHKPIIRTKGLLRMNSCRLHADRLVWVESPAGQMGRDDILRGVQSERFAVVNCADAR